MVHYVRVELKPGEARRIVAGHPWVYANEMAKAHDKLSPGALVEVVSSKGRYVGRGVASPASKILVRLLTWDASVDVDDDLIRSRVHQAVASRKPLLERYDTDGIRLIFGEADGLPGVVVDAYGDKAVLSCHSAGMNPFLPVLASALVQEGFPSVYEKSAGESRHKEGLPDVQGFLKGSAAFPWEFREGKAKFSVDPSHGQKTGYYLDFRVVRDGIGRLSAGRDVLDAFCYQGAASIRAALGGAKRVVGLDGSEEALAAARKNAEANGVADRCEFRIADSFKDLKKMKQEGVLFGGIVLDPPPLAKSVHDLGAGETALRRLVESALDLLAPGGFLVVSSCSHHFPWKSLEEAVETSCRETNRRFNLAERLTQPQDHPIRVGVPETEYLRTVILTETVR